MQGPDLLLERLRPSSVTPDLTTVRNILLATAFAALAERGRHFIGERPQPEDASSGFSFKLSKPFATPPGRGTLRLPVPADRTGQIGRVYLFDLFQRLLWDGVTFHSSASVLIFFSACRTGWSRA